MFFFHPSAISTFQSLKGSKLTFYECYKKSRNFKKTGIFAVIDDVKLITNINFTYHRFVGFPIIQGVLCMNYGPVSTV